MGYLDYNGLETHVGCIKKYVKAEVSKATPTTIDDEEIEEYWSGVDPEAFSEFLPLSGGTMAGNIILADGGIPLSTAGGTMNGMIVVPIDPNDPPNARFVRAATDEAVLMIYGGSQKTTGARIGLNGKDKSNDGGAFSMTADNGTESSKLQGLTNGTLFWHGKRVTADGNIQTVSATVNSDAVSSTGSYHYLYRCGPVVTLGLNINVKASVASGTALITGLPTPPGKIGAGLVAAGTTLRVYLDTDGGLKLDGASPSAVTWFNGCITYITNQ